MTTQTPKTDAAIEYAIDQAMPSGGEGWETMQSCFHHSMSEMELENKAQAEMIIKLRDQLTKAIEAMTPTNENK